MKKTMTVILLTFLVPLGSEVFAKSPPPKRYTPVSRPHTWKEKARDMGLMYVALWAGYYAGQSDVVEKITWEDWRENVFDKGAVLWDGDEWYWNFVAHPLVGSEYYLYFRSRGYARKWSFVGALVTSTIFEELVETFSEPFSFNDFVITPCLGSLLGYGREKAALKLLHTDSKFKRAVGHVLWLETNFRFFEDVELMPAVSPDGKAGGFSLVAVF